MNIRFIGIILCSLLFSDLAVAAEDGCPENMNGVCWNKMQFNERYGLLNGFVQGQKAYEVQADLHGKRLSTFVYRNHYLIPDNTTYKDIMDYLDKLYSYPVNRNIEIYKGMLLAMLYLRDDDSNDRLTLLKIFRAGKNIPTYGEVTKILSPNEFRIKTDEGSFDVVLPRTTSDGVSDEKKAATLNLLNKLVKYTGWGTSSCKEGDGGIKLTYPMDIFTSNGSLRAEISLYGSHVCYNGKAVSLMSLDGQSEIQLSRLLLNNGLVKYDSWNDPKWPDYISDAYFYVSDEVKGGSRYLDNSPQSNLVKLMLKNPSY